ncbi:hypothetical protein RND71_015414 [Anisodus tanguticus]|uniref:Uncharacterized protein n=1 Tax=Anisodus tanguticus TaxID=243964 RepID=A0AAE1S7X5_9SOLA|nr:hypothetical protein RND71_015414 [Anisodus tanguticus]
MASEQARRENVIDEHQIYVKKTRDPKRGGSAAVKVQVGTDFHLAGPGAIHVSNASTTDKHERRSFGHQKKQQHGFEERPGGVKFEVHGQRQRVENVADATKVVVGVASNVAGYTGETAVAAKDAVAGAGMNAVGYVAGANDYVVSSEESAAECAARKKAEAERELEAKRSYDSKVFSALSKGQKRGGIEAVYQAFASPL